MQDQTADLIMEEKCKTYLSHGNLALRVRRGLVVHKVDEAEPTVLAVLRRVGARVDDHVRDAF